MTYFNSKEQKFKELLGNLELQIDTEAVWEEVQVSLPRKEDDLKLPLPFWILTGIFMVGFIWVIGLAIYDTPNSKETIAAPLVEQPSQDVFDSSKAYEVAIEKISDIRNERNIQNELAENLTYRIADVAADATGPSTEEFASIENGTYTEIALELNKSADSNIQAQNAKEYPVIEITNKASLLSNDITESRSEKNRVIADQTKLLADIHSIRLLSNPLNTQSDLPLSAEYASVIEPVMSAKKIRFSYALLGGVNRGFSSYFAPAFNETAFEKRPDITEIDLPGLSSQFQVAAEYGNWRFMAGLKQNYTAARFDKERIAIQAIERNSSTTSSTQLNFVPQTERTHRLHNGLDLQLGVGLNLLSTEKLKLSFNVASSYNLSTSNSGYYLDDFLLTITKFESSEANPYKTTRGFGGEVNLMIERRFSEHVALIIQPSLGTWFSPVNQNISHYKLKNSQVGLMIGISYRPVWE